VSRYQEDFKAEDGVLLVRLSGTFPNELLRKPANAFQPLIDACATHGCKEALIDATALQAKLDTLEMLRAGEDAAQMARLGLRVAIVTRPDRVDAFFEDVAVNRGGEIRVFTAPDAARTWLSDKPG